MRRPIVAFIAIAYSLSIALSLLVALTGGNQSAFTGVGFAAMFVPTIAVVLVLSMTRERLGIDWRRLPVTFLPLALLMIPVTLHAAMLAVMRGVGPLPWATWLTPSSDGLYHTPESQGWGVLTAQGLVFRMLVNAAVGVVVVSALALFEEIGWRGWLLPQLMRRMSARRAVVAASMIWALWHVPFGLSGVQHIDGVSPVRVALLVAFGTVAAGLVIGWLWVRTESIWIAAIAHGALNNWGQYAFKFMEDFAVPDQSVVLGAGFVALYGLGTVLLAFGTSSERTMS
ncbi:MAG TPA: CPBP family intramembrane glutamic endopeptidase [Vicinamibacterales bacterium]|nr:CPBP family intramembrane glutamic endopeptidase [Vicinamibacterales bacterium]